MNDMSTTPQTLAEVQALLKQHDVRYITSTVNVTVRVAGRSTRTGVSGSVAVQPQPAVEWQTVNGCYFAAFVDGKGALRYREQFLSHKAPYWSHRATTAVEALAACGITS